MLLLHIDKKERVERILMEEILEIAILAISKKLTVPRSGSDRYEVW